MCPGKPFKLISCNQYKSKCEMTMTEAKVLYYKKKTII